MQYQIRVAGKIFKSSDLKTLLKRAVEAKRSEFKDRLTSVEVSQPGGEKSMPGQPIQLVPNL